MSLLNNESRMRTILFASLFILSRLISNGQDLKALDDKNGFREAKFGMFQGSFKNLIFVSRDIREGFTYEEKYKMNNDDLHIGDFILDAIYYNFYKGQLISIIIEVNNDYSNQIGVLKVLEAAYGKGLVGENTFPYKHNDYAWDGKLVRMYYDVGNDAISESKGRLIHEIQIHCNRLTSSREVDKKLYEQQKFLDAAKKL
jgi:hypothetical protein